jgi:anti-sigma28 factor (negative regulator of flagellin synthesis)
MSMNVQAGGLSGASNLETARTQETTAAAQNGKRGGAAAPAPGGDSVQISSLSTHIAAAGTVEDAALASRVQALAALHARGEYNVDAASLSHALVSHALNGAEGTAKSGPKGDK